MVSDDGRATGWRRLLTFPLVIICIAVVAAVAVTAVLVSGPRSDNNMSSPCREVLDAAEEIGEGRRPQSYLLDVVRAQEPIAVEDAARNARRQPVAAAITAMREELEAGRLPRSGAALQTACS